MKTISVNFKEFKIIKLLGKGKGGYSYLVSDYSNNLFVVKQIHHEPCSYYTFGNKLESEINDYNKLSNIKVPMPKLIEIDYKSERILKEYIDGDTIDKYVLNDLMKEDYIDQVKKMCEVLYKHNLNIDYFPTNFVVNNDVLYYVDYECNTYMDEWNFENWGIKYYFKTNEFLKHFKKIR